MDLTRGKSGPLKHLVHESKLCTLKKCIALCTEKPYLIMKNLIMRKNVIAFIPSLSWILRTKVVLKLQQSVSLYFFPTFFSRKIANKTVSVPILIVLYIQRGNRSNRKRKEVQSLHKLTKLCIVWSLHEFHSKLKLGR